MFFWKVLKKLSQLQKSLLFINKTRSKVGREEAQNKYGILSISCNKGVYLDEWQLRKT